MASSEGRGEPVQLSGRQATALAADMYRGWADEKKQHTTVAELGHDASGVSFLPKWMRSRRHGRPRSSALIRF